MAFGLLVVPFRNHFTENTGPHRTMQGSDEKSPVFIGFSARE
jgi:hypothetical protein